MQFEREDMINEVELKDMLVALVRLNKKALETSTIALKELASIRESVRPLDPAFSEVLVDKREYYDGAVSPLSADVNQEFDSLIQRLNDRLIR
jgi:hypothetical protein